MPRPREPATAAPTPVLGESPGTIWARAVPVSKAMMVTTLMSGLDIAVPFQWRAFENWLKPTRAACIELDQLIRPLCASMICSTAIGCAAARPHINNAGVVQAIWRSRQAVLAKFQVPERQESSCYATP